MALCCAVGNVQPSEFEEMLYKDTVRLARKLEKIHENDVNLKVDLAKLIARACGARVT